jgi:Na+/proline symporter
MAIKKPKEIRKATLISMIWVILSLYGAIFIGIVGLGMVGQEISDPDHIMPILTRRVLPDWLAGVLISAAIAAMMSTVDSQILVAISAISEDLYHKMINKKASQKTLLVISRTAGISIAVFAFVLALGAEERVYSLVLYAWGGLAAGLGPPIIMSLRWKRTTKWGILSGMIVGTITIIVWHNIPALKNFCYELVPAFLSSLLIIYIVSLFTTPPNNTINNPKDDPYSVRKCGS